ncbi:MAG: transketolase [Candidatus Marinimicrobia bacterium]|nr:transketolase [Candidatus Neomarinimicrobiota bacterium]|tara:strand:+ start:25261 stop:26262 length:1002 start_codon:yes stop_codon:yes gene_type:complete
MEIVNKPYAKAFENFAKDKKEVLCISADLDSSCEIDGFRDRYPNKFISMGMAEQNMMSFSGGLGLAGFRPFIHSFGVFTYRRPYDQLIASIAYPKRRARIMGFLPGITTPGGMTHQAIEDISVMRTLPNMTVLETGDATEVESICEAADSIDGPVYCRILRGSVPRLFKTPIIVGDVRILSEGLDIIIFTSGICTEEAIRARSALKKFGISIKHIHVSTLKPINEELFLSLLTESKSNIITMENHLVNGGLGSIVSDIISKYGLGKKLIKLGLQDTYAHGGSKRYLSRYYNLDAIALIRSIEKLTTLKTKIEEEDLIEARIEDVHSLSKAEAL